MSPQSAVIQMREYAGYKLRRFNTWVLRARRRAPQRGRRNTHTLGGPSGGMALERSNDGRENTALRRFPMHREADQSAAEAGLGKRFFRPARESVTRLGQGLSGR